MKVGDLVKRKSHWKNVEYSPESGGDGVGILIRFYREGAMILWSRGKMGWEVREKLKVIDESR